MEVTFYRVLHALDPGAHFRAQKFYYVAPLCMLVPFIQINADA